MLLDEDSMRSLDDREVLTDSEGLTMIRWAKNMIKAEENKY